MNVDRNFYCSLNFKENIYVSIGLFIDDYVQNILRKNKIVLPLWSMAIRQAWVSSGDKSF